MVFDEMVLPVCEQAYSIVQEAVISLSLLVDGILFSWLSVIHKHKNCIRKKNKTTVLCNFFQYLP